MPINGLTAEDATKAALMFMHTPYVWGGRSLFGIDAGGFIQVILKICRIRVSRNLKDQVNAGTSVHFLDEAKPGNLLFSERRMKESAMQEF
jgi:cell wall-associated NlpC family hydrolase